MKQLLSFSKIENELLPKFRKQISAAESTEDMKKFFSYSMQELLEQVFSGEIEVGFDTISLAPEQDPPFRIDEQTRANEMFSSVWNTSDLSHIINRFSEAAMHRHMHLTKNPAKTEAKIRM